MEYFQGKNKLQLNTMAGSVSSTYIFCPDDFLCIPLQFVPHTQ